VQRHFWRVVTKVADRLGLGLFVFWFQSVSIPELSVLGIVFKSLVNRTVLYKFLNIIAYSICQQDGLHFYVFNVRFGLLRFAFSWEMLDQKLVIVVEICRVELSVF
jgi:hypothetical protein